MTPAISAVAGDVPATDSGAAGPARAPRRSPGDMPFGFATADLVARLVTERGEPDWLRDERLTAASAFGALPVETNQLYTPYVDLRAAALDSAEPWIATESAVSAPGSNAIGDSLPDGVDGFIDLREDKVVAVALSGGASSAGVTLETFGAALERDPDGFRADIEGGSTLPSADKLAQLARGFWSQGARLVVPDGVRLARPILVRWQSGNPDRAMITRTLVRLGVGASATVVEEQVPSGAEVDRSEGQTVPQGFFHGTTEVVLGAEARLSFASIQDFGLRQIAFQHRYARIGEAASLHWAMAQLGGRLVRSRVDNRLEGDRGSVEQVEIVFATDEQLFDLTSYTTHLGRDTTGNLLSKGALMDRARSYMKGLITIEKSAVGTDSYLGEFGMNLSKATRAVAIPSLEIDQPDCRRAMHASSVGPIDQGQLFYLESRGISPDDARKFIVLGFLEPVVARVPLEATQDRLRELLDAKWAAGRLADPSGAAGTAA
ncbi:MAG: SufD family Fe-S cluster assembly protein [Chloroflexota bacterium]